ncbi:tetratricopeptide repeat protein, partial [Enterobacter hormaechei]|uniref:tetratricopeptide repeat protein n=1 Tax=Enterobacter hormaechei TaxID=158836 RepID=UPI0013CF90FF
CPALESIARALLIAPDNLDALQNRAGLLRQLGRFGEALEAFDDVIARLPNLAAAHDLRARTLAALGRHREA